MWIYNGGGRETWRRLREALSQVSHQGRLLQHGCPLHKPYLEHNLNDITFEAFTSPMNPATQHWSALQISSLQINLYHAKPQILLLGSSSTWEFASYLWTPNVSKSVLKTLKSYSQKLGLEIHFR